MQNPVNNPENRSMIVSADWSKHVMVMMNAAATDGAPPRRINAVSFCFGTFTIQSGFFLFQNRLTTEPLTKKTPSPAVPREGP